jgi:hypothetical protein
MKKIQLAIASTLVLATAGLASAQAPKPAATPAPAAAAPAAAAKPAATAAAPAAAAKPAAAKPAAAAPAAAAPAGPPKPAKELEAFMKPFDGSWKCDTKFSAGAFGPGSPEVNAKSTVKFKKDLDGFVYRGEFEVKKQKGVEMAVRGVFYIGWDPGAQQFVVTNADNMGGMGLATGKLQGDSLTYAGDQYTMGMKIKTRETMGKKSDKEAFHKFEVDMGKGWTLFGEDNCKK